MNTGAITSYIDVAQVVLYAFWIFFAGLIIYLRREDKREGYPLESERSQRVRHQGFPAIPRPKIFMRVDASIVLAPRERIDIRILRAVPRGNFLGAPLHPEGDPLADAVGPAAYADRANVPDLAFDRRPAIVPMRLAPGFHVDRRDPNPRGMTVYGDDYVRGGVVTELWVDRAEVLVRYLEVDTGVRRVLLPYPLARFDRRRNEVLVKSILGGQFAGVPTHASPDQVTKLEEDRISAYYGGGMLYATPARSEPFL